MSNKKSSKQVNLLINFLFLMWIFWVGEWGMEVISFHFIPTSVCNLKAVSH